MSVIQNDILLEQLYEKYLDAGYGEVEAEILAQQTFQNKSI